jgi:protein-disulfide isomerase
MSLQNAGITKEDHTQGESEAPLVLLEYGDFQCPSCGQAYEVIKKVQSYFGEDLLFCYRHFPLVEIHPYALPAAEAAEWAASHNRFWEMHDLIFENQEQLSPEMLLLTAKRLELNPEGLAAALDERKYLSRVQRDMDLGMESGVEGTPTFFINGEKHVGGYDFESLVSAIRGFRYLKRAS